MDMNELLKQHQIALMNSGQESIGSAGSTFDMVRHYEKRIKRLRKDLGVAEY